jgi:hypothetical protein
MASAITLGTTIWLCFMIFDGTLGSPKSTGVAWLTGAGALMGWTLWNFFRSKTTLTLQALHQSWIWDKQVALNDLAYAKLIRVNGLNWLIAPRLYVRTLDGKFSVFYAAGAPMITQFEKIAQQLKSVHGQV